MGSGLQRWHSKELIRAQSRIITEWDTLPVYVIHAGSVNAFKSRLTATPLCGASPSFPSWSTWTLGNYHPDPDVCFVHLTHQWALIYRLLKYNTLTFVQFLFCSDRCISLQKMEVDLQFIDPGNVSFFIRYFFWHRLNERRLAREFQSISTVSG